MKTWLIRTLLAFWIAAQCLTAANAHDTWVETNSPLVRLGDNVYVELKLGNHGNDHRDFKLAGKVGLDVCQIAIVSPSGDKFDLKPQFVDMGMTAKEGYWASRFITKVPGSHVVAMSSESLRGKTRSMKSAKAYFLASAKLDELSAAEVGFDQPLGHELEIVPLTTPVTNTRPGQPIRVRILLRTKPMKGARVSFIPRGTILEEGFDKAFERETTEDGIAEYSPKEGNVILIVVHHSAPELKGEGFDDTKYSATLTITVPQQNPLAARTISSK